jgi:pimeloyl-ACP methyl ester carboxylesterase
MTHYRSQKIQLDSPAGRVEIAYSQAGHGLPLLFVHGYPLNCRLWQPQFADLLDTARVIAPDLRGHGESQVTPGPYSMEMFADDLNALLDALGASEKIVLCGLSMGGYVAFAFARKYPERLAGLILTATRAAADGPEAKAGRDQAMQTASENGSKVIFDAMLPKLLSPDTFAHRPDIVAQVRAIMEHTPLETILADLAGLRDRRDSTDLLPSLRIPSLLLPGEHDAIVPLHEAQAMHAAIPNSQLQIIPQAGHLANLENPRIFNQAVCDFLGRIKNM